MVDCISSVFRLHTVYISQSHLCRVITTTKHFRPFGILISTCIFPPFQTQAILDARLREELSISLSISVYDVDRNEKARLHRREEELKREEEERIRKEKEMDYLAPFLARIGDPASLTKAQMKEVSESCLHDLRTRLVDMANIIQVGKIAVEGQM